MTGDKTVTSRLIRHAREVVANVQREGCPLIGACIVSSLAAGDFTSASDVDMLMVAADGEGRPDVFRRLVGGRVFEWMVLSNGYLKDVDAILAHAGLCHDIVDAIILLDMDGWLQQVQREAARHYQAPEWIWKRTTGQLQLVADSIGRMRERLADGDILAAQRAHVSVMKGLFAIPSAILNKRLTMARGLSFCREATTELGWPEYLAGVLTMFGVEGLSVENVVELQGIADRIVSASKLTETDKAIRRRFLQSSPWLLEHAQPADAVWPLCFWSSYTVEQSGSRHWRKFAAILGVGDEQELLQKIDQAERLHELAVGLVDAYRPPDGRPRGGQQD